MGFENIIDEKEEAGYHHHIGELPEWGPLIKLMVWMMEEVTWCSQCHAESVIPSKVCPAGGEPRSYFHVIEMKSRKREIIVWLDFDAATNLGQSLLRDAAILVGDA